MERNEYCKELDVAVKAVHLACALCRRIQQGLISDHVLSKDDDSLVTLAGHHQSIHFRFLVNLLIIF